MAPPVDPLVLLRDILIGHQNYGLSPAPAVLDKLCSLSNELVDERDRHEVRAPVHSVREQAMLSDMTAMAREFIAGRAALSPHQVLQLAATVVALGVRKEVQA